MTHPVTFDRAAEKALERLHRADQGLIKRIIATIEELAEYPYAHRPDRKALRGYGVGMMRIRVGDYRIVCELSTSGIRVVRIAHRRDVYKH